MKTIAFIFARGGSKGLPNKNIKLLGGIPLIGHSILSAKENNSISAIYVSTDSQKIKDVAIELGANIIDRPDNLATDNSPEWFSWRHAVEELGDKGIKFDCFVSLPATAPLRSDDDINQCILALKEGVDMERAIRRGMEEHIEELCQEVYHYEKKDILRGIYK